MQNFKSSLEFLDNNRIAITSKNKPNDWIAGTFQAMGWVIIRNGAVGTHDFVKKLGHEFQTLFLTINPFKQKTDGD